MPDNEYRFLTRWSLPAPRRQVFDVLRDAEGLPRWWPAVYLEVREVEPGDSRGVGRVVSLHTKGWLPYTLRWSFRVVEVREPAGFSIEAFGDFVGSGVWTLAPDGEQTAVEYDWRIRADKPLLRRLSFLMRRVFEANHRWAMARGEESLKLELRRRYAASPDERALVPAPPGPTDDRVFWAIAAAVPLGAAAAALLAAARKRWRRPADAGWS